MRVDDYENLPDGMTAAEVADIIDIFLREQASDNRQEQCRKLEVICDKQWHTYEVPSHTIQENIQRWIEVNWQDSSEYCALVMGLCYCFALPKSLFENALQSYHGEQRWDYVQMLEKSEGERIDPYWSMRR